MLRISEQIGHLIREMETMKSSNGNFRVETHNQNSPDGFDSKFEMSEKDSLNFKVD